MKNLEQQVCHVWCSEVADWKDQPFMTQRDFESYRLDLERFLGTREPFVNMEDHESFLVLFKQLTTIIEDNLTTALLSPSLYVRDAANYIAKEKKNELTKG